MHPQGLWWPWLAAIATPGVATLVAHWADSRMSIAGLAMVYLLAVSAAAVVLSRGPAMLAAVLCVASLNFFFVHPRYTLRVDEAESWWMLAVLLALAIAMNGMVASLRVRRARAELANARSHRLYALSERLSAKQDAAALAQSAAGWLQDELGLACAVFLVDPDAGNLRCHARPGSPAFDAAPASWAIEHGRPLGRGCDDWPSLALWCAPFERQGSTGAVQILLGDGARPDAETRQHWLALARQVGLSIGRQQAAQAAQAADQSARAEAARNTLLASLSHDLRTPLAGILGNASALRSQGDQLSAHQRERLLDNLENDARDMALLSDNVLQVARLSQPHSQLTLQPESLEEVLGVAVARMRRRWPQARFELKVPRDLPPVAADAGLLAQAVANLLDNAVRHGGDTPRIIVQAGRSREGVFFAVRDHGGGLPPGDPERLFDRFGQGKRGGSAGLGLALCRMVARAHGGEVEARRCDPGAEFRVDLPVNVAAEAPR